MLFRSPPIYYAVSPGDEAILRLLLAKGAKVNPPPEKKDNTPLHNAETANIARILIDNGAIVDALNKNDQSPLHGFALSGRRDLVELLLSAGANPRLKDKEGKTPLHHAAGAWRAGVVAPLIAKGANPNERNAHGAVPLDGVIPFNSGQNRDANRAAQVETLQALLAGGANPNLTATGTAPHLFRAVQEGFEEAAEVLLKEIGRAHV